MSKFVKDLMTQEVKDRLEGVDGLLLVNVIGLTSNESMSLRKQLREKNINLMVVKNSLARRATEGTVLGPAFEGVEGANAVCWGAEDFVSLCKEISALSKSDDFEEFKTTGGVMDGEKMSPEKVAEVSKWPNRLEQLSILSGQLTAPWRTIAGQLNGPGGQLASQIKKKSEEE